MASSVREFKGRSLLELPSSYVSVDLETTGLDPRVDEIIEVSAIKYENDNEVDRFHSLVNPGIELDDFIVELTGITDEMLSNAPCIDIVLPKFVNFIGDNIIVGHNVNFDINFIYDNAAALSLPPFTNDFVDTMRISRRLFKELPNHKLETLMKHLSVGNRVEHRAYDDCVDTQQCFIKMKHYVNETGASLTAYWERYGSLSKSIVAETTEFDKDGPMYGKVFAFTGGLSCMSRKEAMQAVVNRGGLCGDGVTQKTNYLVLGSGAYRAALDGDKSSKHKKAEKMKLSGHEIAIISENVFFDMLSF